MSLNLSEHDKHIITIMTWKLLIPMYQIGGVAAPRGEKRKNSGTITVQAASKSRRHFKHCGSSAATSGRRVDDMPAHSLNIRLDTGDDEAGDEVTFNNVQCEAFSSNTEDQRNCKSAPQASTRNFMDGPSSPHYNKQICLCFDNSSRQF